jgi:hypothetical protein
MKQDKLNDVLRLHKLWMEKNPSGIQANLLDADLTGAYLRGAYLQGAYLQGANLREADLQGAYLQGAYLQGAYLRGAYLQGANLTDTKGLLKIMGVEPGNYYWKAVGNGNDDGLSNNGYLFHMGLNLLRDGEVFVSDERLLCSFPGFHFASKSWVKSKYGGRKYLCKIRIPEDAKINEPWAANGKASADKIEIVQILLMSTEKDVTEQFRNLV